MKKILPLIASAMILVSSAHCQETITGSVRDGDTKQGVPYAAVYMMNTHIGTSCNESGQFVLHIPQGMENTSVVISSLGYRSDTITMTQLHAKDGAVTLTPAVIQLNSVPVVEYSSARKLMEAVIERIPQNYRTEEAVGIWHYRNRQMLNDRTYIKSEGLIRNFMSATGDVPKLRLHFDSAKKADDLFRYYQMLDTILIYDSAYWRSVVGSKELEELFNLTRYGRPSDYLYTIGSDFVTYLMWRKKSIFKNSSFSMQTFAQDGRGYYQVTIAMPSKDSIFNLLKIIINKTDLAIIDVTYTSPRQNYMPADDLLIKRFWDRRTYTGSSHWRYQKYDGKYQLAFIHREYEDCMFFSQVAKERGCKSSPIVISGSEECVLSEHSYDVADYKKRYVKNKHPRTEENIKETERILRQPHSKIPW